MTDKKLTDNEIVKALNEAEDLENVLLYCKNPNKEVMTPIKITDIRDLINRLQAENERLQKNLEEAHIDIKELLAENKRLKDAIDEQDIEIAKLWKRIEEAKAEAYKECIERVYKFICDTQNWGTLHREFLENGECYWLKQKLNNLLKELAGDSDA